jgi:voltage-gated potassium channel Kch
VDKIRFSWLLLALLVFLVIVPIADDLSIASKPVIRALGFSSIVLIGIWSLRGGGRLYYLGIFFVIAALVTNILAANLASPLYLYASFASLFGFLLVAIAYTLGHVARGTDINVNRLIGAVCIYLLLGVIWAVAYTAIEIIAPGSFKGFAPTLGRGWDSEWLYFSFVTMTTLGYGDISPVSATAKVLAYFQAVFGQFYIAILVAGLVSGFISGRQNKKGDED